MNPQNRKNDDKSDREIARLVQEGEEELFGIIIDRYEDKLIRYGWHFLNTKEDIEDIVQEVFIKIYKNIQSYNSKKKFSPWMYRIAHNEFVNKLDKKSRSPLHFFDPDEIFPHLLAREENSTDKYAKKELAQTLKNCLKDLGPKYREAVILYYFEDLSYEEIAEIIRVPTATVGTRLRRAKKKLKNSCPQLNQFYE